MLGQIMPQKWRPTWRSTELLTAKLRIPRNSTPSRANRTLDELSVYCLLMILLHRGLSVRKVSENS